jgi:dTDP-4-amino-4,6-dideoxygalactose transaminase
MAQSESARSKIMSILFNKNIPSMIYYKLPLHLQTVMKRLRYKKGDFPKSEKVSKQIFSIPMHPYLDKNQQNRIIEILNSI